MIDEKKEDIDKFLEKKEAEYDLVEDFKVFQKNWQKKGYDIPKTKNILKLFDVLNVMSDEELFTAKKMVDIFFRMTTEMVTNFGDGLK